MATLGWIVAIAVAIVVALRVKSLLRPEAFPPWMTPVLSWGRDRGRILERAGIAPGERLLEVGPGAGWITQAAAEAVGEKGRVVCLDLQPAMLRKVRDRLGDRAALVCASGSVLPFRDGSFDRAFLARVLGEIPDKTGACRELFRVVRPGGELAVEEGLPDPDYVGPSRLARLAEGAGFRAGPRADRWHEYTWRFTRPQGSQST